MSNRVARLTTEPHGAEMECTVIVTLQGEIDPEVFRDLAAPDFAQVNPEMGGLGFHDGKTQPGGRILRLYVTPNMGVAGQMMFSVVSIETQVGS